MYNNKILPVLLNISIGVRFSGYNVLFCQINDLDVPECRLCVYMYVLY